VAAKTIEAGVLEQVERNVAMFRVGEEQGRWWQSTHVVRRLSSWSVTVAFVVFTAINVGAVLITTNTVRHDTARLDAFDLAHCHDGKITSGHQAARWQKIADTVKDLSAESTRPRVRRHILDIALVASQAANELRHVSEPSYCHTGVQKEGP
jgi:hypothetical protein